MVLLSESDSGMIINIIVEEIVLDENISLVGVIFDSLYIFVFGEDGLNLNDGFDIFNIVNYLFIVLDIYEVIIFSYVDVVVSLVGSFLYGGMVGMLYNVVDLVVEGMIGKSIFFNLWDVGK